MSGFFNQVLGGVVEGFASNPNLRDFTHASKTFTTNGFGNSPKFKWLFHVYIDINKNYITENIDNVFPATTNYGVLVKSIQLPKFNIALTELNQYNRKRYVQTKINYDPVSITFHDDNLSQIKNLWTAYYNYYYWDASSGGAAAKAKQPGDVATGVNVTNIYSPDISGNQNWGYNSYPATTAGKNAGGKGPFFKSIRIYGFDQHNFAGYELINPWIESFQHDQYNYYETSGTMEHSMTLRYESVNYFQGSLKGDNPETLVTGFGNNSIYDRRKSPITNAGSTRSTLGQGGLLDSAANIFDNLAKGNIQGVLGAAQTAIRTVNTYGNVKNLTRSISSDIQAGIVGAVGTALSPRGFTNSPADGATTGAGSQAGGATNLTNGQSNTKPVAIPSNPGGAGR